jgi:hypothetical protein
MPYTDLLRTTVLVSGAMATLLGAISAIAVGGEPSSTTVIVALAWWAIAIIIGFRLGRPERAREEMRDVLAKAKMATFLPSESPTRIALQRLWPIAVVAIVAGGLGLFFPGVAIIGAGYGLAVSLAFHAREGAVQAIEERDGVRFYVLPTSALKPIELVRTPGLRSERAGAF